jgi:hypothetical protein
MPNVNWKILYQHSLTLALALVSELIAMSLLNIENPFIILFSGIAFYFILLAIVQATWTRADRWIRKNKNHIKEYWYRPVMKYYFKTDNNNFLNLHIESHSKNNKTHLTLELSRIKFISAEDKFKETRDVGISNIRDKRLYDKDIESGDVRFVCISQKSVEGKDMLSVPFDYFGIRLVAGKYFYELYEYGTHKGVNFDRKTIKREFVYNEKGEFEY